MGESSRRQVQDPLYGVVPKTGVISPLWTVYKGVLFLVGRGGSIACLPASNMITPNEEQLLELGDILSSNPSLALNTPNQGEGISSGTIGIRQGSVPTNVTTINLL